VKIDYGNCDDDDDDELGYSVLNLISGLTISSAASVVFVAQRIHNTTTRRDVVDCATSCATNPQHDNNDTYWHAKGACKPSQIRKKEIKK